MRNNITRLSFGQDELLTQTRMEIWMNGTGMVLSKYVFWMIVLLSITIEINAQSVDTDGDGIVNSLDLDDDNDGLLDETEDACFVAEIKWEHNENGGQSDFATYSPNSEVFFTSAQDVIFGWGLDENSDNYTYTYLLRNADASTYSEAKTNNDYVELSFVPSEELELKGIDLGFWTNNEWVPDYNCGNFKVAIEYSDEGGFSNPTLLFEDIQVGDMLGGDYVSIPNDLSSENMILAEGVSHVFRFYLYDEQNTDWANRVRFDDVKFPVVPLSTCDTDGDGLADIVDLDSDDDGCPDALEGSGNFALTEIENDTLVGGIDENGVPIVATAAGQDLGSAQDAGTLSAVCIAMTDTVDTDGDGIVNSLDLDDDNDGLLDETEDACFVAEIKWDHNENGGQSDFATYSPNSEVFFTSAQDATFGWGLDENSDNYTYTYLLRNADASTYSEAKTNNDYVELSFVPSEALELKGIDLGFWTNNTWVPDYNCGNFKVAIEYSNEGGFSNPTLLFEDIQVGDMLGGDYVSIPNDLSSENMILAEGVSHVFRFYLYDEQNTDWANRVRFDDVKFPVVPLSTCDTDGDGLADIVDLDSDDDGCPDALEGSGNFALTEIENDTLVGGIDGNGVPIVATAAGQDLGSAQDAGTLSAVCIAMTDTVDTDGDGIVNSLDLDDDNDGLLDETEDACFVAEIKWEHNENGGQSDFATYSPNSEVFFTSAQDATFGWGLDENSDNYTYTYLLRNADASTYSEAKTNNDYVELSFVPSEALELKGIDLGFWTNNTWVPDYNCGNFKVAIEYSNEGGFSNPTLLFEDIQVGDMLGGDYVSIPNDLSSENMILAEGISHVFRFYLYDEQNTDWANRVRFDDVKFPVVPLSTCDTDGDGLADIVDLDSDDDGCPDALEGSGNFALTEIENDTLLGGVDENGVPIVATAAGQDLGSAQDAGTLSAVCIAMTDTVDTDGDGIVNSLDLDDDNDGLLDETEDACFVAEIKWEHNENGGQSDFATYSPNSEVFFTSAQDATFGWGLDENSDNYTYTYLLRNADASTYSEAKTNNDYVELSFVPSEALELKGIDLGFWTNNEWVPDYNCGNFKVAIEYSNEGGFSNPTLLFEDIQVGDMLGGDYVSIPNDLSSENMILAEGVSHVFRFYLYDEQNTDWANRVRFDDVKFPVVPLSTCDTDGDGLADIVDLDSDDDGCPDALEGSGNFSYTDIENDTLVGGIDENGVPLVATAAGQDLGAARDSSQFGLACMTLAENDINQTPMDTDVSGNVLTNDSDPTGDDQLLQSVSFLNDQGIEFFGQIGGNPSDVYDKNGVLAGTMSINSDGSYDLDPTSTFIGEVPMNYVVEDANGATDAATLVIEVIPYNHATTNEGPIANDDTNTTEMDTDVDGNVITPNDHDLENNGLTVSEILADVDGDGMQEVPITVGTGTVVYGENAIGDPVIAGTITLNNNGHYSFDPTVEFSGKLSIDYTITDGNAEDEANLTILVLPNTGNQSFANDDLSTGNVDVSQSGNILDNDNDPEDDLQAVTEAKDNLDTPLMIDGATENPLPSRGSVILDMDGSFVYNPGEGFIGTESVVYIVCDNARPESACDTATLYLTTLPFNSLASTDDFNNTPFEIPLTACVSTNDFDAEGDELTYSLTSINGGMNLFTGYVIMETNGMYDYFPGNNFSGFTQFEYQVCDDGVPALCDTSIVYLKVLPAISAETIQLVANPDAHTIEAGQTGTGNVMVNDLDPDDLDPAVTTTVNNAGVEGIDDDGNVVFPAGTMSLLSDGSYTFTPVNGFTGMVIQPYAICNVEAPAVCDNTELRLKVIPDVGNTTFANDDAIITDAGVMVEGNILANDNDSEMDTQSVSDYLIDTDGDGMGDVSGAIGRPAMISGTDDMGDYVAEAGLLTLNFDGSFSFVPASGFTGNLNIPYTVCDDAGMEVACADATLIISVLKVNRDYGDGPAVYPAVWHRATTDADGNNELDGSTDVWLGMNTSFESGSTDPNVGDQFDDAISFGTNPGQFPLYAEAGESYDVHITVNSSQPDIVFYGMWIDWNEDGVYDDFYTGSQQTASPAIATATITAPASTTGTINVRVRADDNPFSASDFAGGKTNGEAEDFQALVVLPVELGSFVGRANGCLVDLQWHTESEENFSHFEVERSENGRDFEKLAEIKGTGGDNVAHSYSYLDKNAMVENYYRLKMIDLDGSVEFSKVINVKTDCGNTRTFKLYPNPGVVGDGVLSLRFEAITNEAHIQIADMTGRVIRRVVVDADIHQVNTLQMELSDLQEGSYYLQLIDGTNEYSETFILLNED